jgi:hypothetical protein
MLVPESANLYNVRPLVVYDLTDYFYLITSLVGAVDSSCATTQGSSNQRKLRSYTDTFPFRRRLSIRYLQGAFIELFLIRFEGLEGVRGD